jgi:primosomal protein N'
MIQTTETRPGGAGSGDTCLLGSERLPDSTTRPNPQDKLRNPHAVREAKRQLRLEFLHECAGGIQIHAALVQTFAEIGDTAGVCYALKRLFSHVKAAHPVYVELRDETGGKPVAEPRTLRTYQEPALDLLRESLRTGHRRPLLQLPTGAGKTRIAAEIINKVLIKGRQAIFVVPQMHRFKSRLIRRFRAAKFRLPTL